MSERFDRERWGSFLWEQYRKDMNRMVDDGHPEPDWNGLDHERQLAFRNAAEALALELVTQIRDAAERQFTVLNGEISAQRAAAHKHLERALAAEAELARVTNELFQHRISTEQYAKEFEAMKADTARVKERAELAEHMVRQLSAVLITAGAPEFANAEHAHSWATATASQAVELARVKAGLKAYTDAVDAQPWATDEPVRVQLDEVTSELTTLGQIIADSIKALKLDGQRTPEELPHLVERVKAERDEAVMLATGARQSAELQRRLADTAEAASASQQARAEKAETELAALRRDKERLDFCEQGGWAMIVTGEDQTLRDAIDAAMKGGANG